jgi:hypothetical protein
MKFRVTFSERDGRPGKPAIFPSQELAQAYARAVKGTVEPVLGDERHPTVTRCPAADREAVEEASRRYWAEHWDPRDQGSRTPRRPDRLQLARGPVATFGDLPGWPAAPPPATYRVNGKRWDMVGRRGTFLQ